jgi:hypothetical protein
MAQRVGTPNLLERIAVLEERLAQMERTGWERDELPFYPTGFFALGYDDGTTFSTLWETAMAPRTASLNLGLVVVGDQVGGVNTGGAWQVLLNGSVVWSGTVPATYTLQFPVTTLSLAAYRGTAQVQVEIQVRRTSGASTGGRTGNGGSIGLSPRFARLL